MILTREIWLALQDVILTNFLDGYDVDTALDALRSLKAPKRYIHEYLHEITHDIVIVFESDLKKFL